MIQRSALRRQETGDAGLSAEALAKAGGFAAFFSNLVETHVT